MSFQPIIPATGIVGWNFLQATYDKQFETFTQDAVLQRDNEYFLENIGKIETAEDLVKDYRLLNIALGAFGLEEDSYKKALVQKILEDGTTADDALANTMGDDRYVQFSEAFGFGPGETVKTGSLQDMADLIYTNKVQAFEKAVGEQDQDLRVAMYAQHEVLALAEDGTSVDTKWFNVMGQPALQDMFVTALGLPESFGQIDIEQQLDVMKDRAYALFGSDDLSIFSDPDQLKKLTNTFLARAQIADFNASQSSGATALMLLQS